MSLNVDKILMNCCILYIQETLRTKFKIRMLIPYGSVNYGVHSEKSDLDFIMVVEDNLGYDHINTLSYQGIPLDINIYSEKQWAEKAENRDVDYLECRSLNANYTILETIEDFEKVRCSISKTASNSFVKCKKKLTVEKDYNPYIGKKSLWHSLRILMFGIQIMQRGCIYNWAAANYLYEDIVLNPNNNWEYYKKKYQPLYNELKTKLKIVQAEAEKEISSMYNK